ncbi:polymer-forming cytoskeletal protein [Pontixanthobacter sp. CEM42]|uniref:bactofilin family protein n=1 Tax=Pontixanthobacter sp. CEM42 TaxID=2792077 RepID=UPI001AE03B38|nr:polymer-forming cytoskeletal protein [Pontixanthobacter sp. CEM42]
MSSKNSTFSVIGSDVTIKGDVSASTELHVDGAIEGDITCASLVQGESSVIDGAIKAESARMAGTLTGSITARELVILKSARIRGDVQYDALTIEQGAQVEGRFAPQGSQSSSPAKSKSAGSEEEPKLIVAN